MRRSGSGLHSNSSQGGSVGLKSTIYAGHLSSSIPNSSIYAFMDLQSFGCHSIRVSYYWGADRKTSLSWLYATPNEKTSNCHTPTQPVSVVMNGFSPGASRPRSPDEVYPRPQGFVMEAGERRLGVFFSLGQVYMEQTLCTRAPSWSTEKDLHQIVTRRLEAHNCQKRMCIL